MGHRDGLKLFSHFDSSTARLIPAASSGFLWRPRWGRRTVGSTRGHRERPRRRIAWWL